MGLIDVHSRAKACFLICKLRPDLLVIYMRVCVRVCFHLLRNQGEWLSSILSGREQQRELLEKRHESHSVSSTADARRVCWGIQSQKNNIKKKFHTRWIDTVLELRTESVPDLRTWNVSCLNTAHGKPIKENISCFQIRGNWCLPPDGSWSPPPLCRLQWDGAGMCAYILVFLRCFFCWWDSCSGWCWSSWGTQWETEPCNLDALSESRLLETAGATGSENENKVENWGFLMLQGVKVLGKIISKNDYSEWKDAVDWEFSGLHLKKTRLRSILYGASQMVKQPLLFFVFIWLRKVILLSCYTFTLCAYMRLLL